jgi:hypothetical protein
MLLLKFLGTNISFHFDTFNLATFSSENVFSSLVGLQFLWQLIPRMLDNSSHHLVHIPLKETHLSDCSGFCGDMNVRFELEDKVGLNFEHMRSYFQFSTTKPHSMF